jgi:hypothetical protein
MSAVSKKVLYHHVFALCEILYSRREASVNVRPSSVVFHIINAEVGMRVSLRTENRFVLICARSDVIPSSTPKTFSREVSLTGKIIESRDVRTSVALLSGLLLYDRYSMTESGLN